MEKKLKHLRKISGLTQFALARKARVSRPKIADAETGRGPLTVAERGRILLVLAACINKNAEEANAALQAIVNESENAPTATGGCQ